MIYEYTSMAKDIEKNLLNYILAETHTNTRKENNAINFFEEWFSGREYFRLNPEKWGFNPIPNDYLNRKIPWGLVKGTGDKTIVFIHHSDTVDILDYGNIKDLAYEPSELTKSLRQGALELHEEVERDLESGEWLFGRGVADMKGGGAIQLSLIDKYSKIEGFNGNLLILTLPDEENLSAGMRSVANLLKELKKKFSLNYVLMLNSEPHERKTANEPVLYDGSIGKLMPLVYVRGKLAHVGQIYNGFNPIVLLSEIVKRTELNTDFMDIVGDEAAPPPTWLYFKDGKDVYDVSLPISAKGYMSVLTLKSSPKRILDMLEGICKDAFFHTIEHMNTTYREYCQAINMDYKQLPWEVSVKNFGELFEEARSDSGEDFIKAYNLTMEEMKMDIESGSITMVDAGYKLIEKTLEFVHDSSPTVVIALAPPYYPHVSNDMIQDSAKPIKNMMDYLIDFAKNEWNQNYSIQKYFTGISDLSYAIFQEDEETIEYIKDNMVLWGEIYNIPFELIKELSMPVINIGPWGKDFHKNTERVYKEDLYYRTPRLIDEVIKEILQD